ncbi:MAG: signal peptide peptidase SppA [Gemmataceae bacterium]|nr:signal peptide peptidase SppA [Gemmataceae bacterium]
MNIRYLASFFIGVALLSNSAWAQDKKAEEKKKPPQVAHLKFSGSLSESAGSSDPFLSSMQETLKSRLDRLKKAAKDPEIAGLILEIQDLGVGWGKLDELTAAVQDFRKSGKKVFCYLQSGEMKDYLLGLSCDRIFVPESGWLMLTGMRAEVTFYKELLDLVGASAEFLKMGDFKSAVEPYTRTSMSESSRKQMESMLDDYFDYSIVKRILAGRGKPQWTADKVRALIDKGPYTAKDALKLGLVDQVEYYPGFIEAFKKELNTESLALLKNYGKSKAEEIDLSNPFALLKLLAGPKTAASNNKPKVAVVYASGVITTGSGGMDFLGDEAVGSTSMIQAIRQAENDKTVKAIVLRIDSPGGSALASDLIWAELKRCKKPIIASMSDVAASGGYYIAMAASRIFADPGTLTGSIGVFGGKINLGGTYGKLGVKTEVITRGANANLFSTSHGFSESEKLAMTRLIEDCYDQFLTKALEGRKKAGQAMTRKTLESLAGGRVWTGRQAKENGLIDELGGMKEALAYAAKQGGLPDVSEPELLLLPKSKSFIDALLDPRPEASLKHLEAIPGVSLLKKELQGLGGLLMLRQEPVWTLIPMRLNLR